MFELFISCPYCFNEQVKKLDYIPNERMSIYGTFWEELECCECEKMFYGKLKVSLDLKKSRKSRRYNEDD